MKKRKDGRYQRQVTLQNGTTHHVYGKTIAELNEAADRLRDMEREGLIIGDDTTVGEWAKIWINKYKCNLRPNTIKMYKSTYNVHIMPYLATMRLKDIRPVHAVDVMSVVSKKSNSLRRKVLITLRQIFSTARDNGLMFGDPTKNIKISASKAPKKKKQLTDDEKEKFAAVIKELGDREALLFGGFCLYCGLRREEALGLKDTDIIGNELTVNRTVTFPDNNAAVVSDELKTSAANRKIPIPDKLLEIIEETGILKNRTRIGYYLISRNGQDPLYYSAFIRMWAKITKQLSFKVTPHMLRHTYARTLYKAHIDLKTAQYLLGHSDIRMTADIYTELEAEDARDSIIKINNYLSGKDPENPVNVQNNPSEKQA